MLTRTWLAAFPTAQGNIDWLRNYGLIFDTSTMLPKFNAIRNILGIGGDDFTNADCHCCGAISEWSASLCSGERPLALTDALIQSNCEVVSGDT